MMRNVVMKISAVFLAACYLMSIIGFGVHTCLGTERSFLTTFISGDACEDIHPEHHCGDSHHCCGEGECHDCDHEQGPGALSFDSQPCCSDEFLVLTITGTIPSSENDYSECHCNLCNSIADLPYGGNFKHLRSEINRIMSLPDSGVIVPGDFQSVLGIWRI